MMEAEFRNKKGCFGGEEENEICLGTLKYLIHDGNWNIPKTFKLLALEVTADMQQIIIPGFPHATYSQNWCGSNDGDLSFRSDYDSFTSKHNEPALPKLIWQGFTPPAKSYIFTS
ncbi:unnamed protein product [Vicia faba]|uniref:Uncharacterized protein n=1 Tax=Vicia faba TaxID=3906 RepID=A0AAV1B4H8_VICFA|nr:unnamed protein product [Vicia faba]